MRYFGVNNDGSVSDIKLFLFFGLVLPILIMGLVMLGCFVGHKEKVYDCSGRGDLVLEFVDKCYGYKKPTSYCLPRARELYCKEVNK
jgi:hypothetical protein